MCRLRTLVAILVLTPSLALGGVLFSPARNGDPCEVTQRILPEQEAKYLAGHYLSLSSTDHRVQRCANPAYNHADWAEKRAKDPMNRVFLRMLRTHQGKTQAEIIADLRAAANDIQPAPAPVP